MNKCFIGFFLGLLLAVSCQKNDTIKQVDDVCTMMDDIAFMKYCYDSFDVNHDGKVSMEEAKAVTKISVGSRGINSLKGIEYFSNLKQLVCSSNNVSSLDVSGFSQLYSLSCGNNSLSSLSVSKNLVLTELECESNYLTSLDITKNTKLTHLNCRNNTLSSLDVSKNDNLEVLLCGDNNLSSLDLSKNKLLHTLSCKENNMTELDLSSNPKIKNLVANPQKNSVIISIIGLPSSFLPPTPTGIALFSMTDSTLAFQWDAKEGVTSYKWELSESGNVIQQGVEKQRHVTLSGLKSNTEYVFSLRTQNDYGLSEPVSLTAKTK